MKTKPKSRQPKKRPRGLLLLKVPKDGQILHIFTYRKNLIYLTEFVLKFKVSVQQVKSNVAKICTLQECISAFQNNEHDKSEYTIEKILEHTQSVLVQPFKKNKRYLVYRQRILKQLSTGKPVSAKILNRTINQCNDISYSSLRRYYKNLIHELQHCDIDIIKVKRGVYQIKKQINLQ